MSDALQGSCSSPGRTGLPALTRSLRTQAVVDRCVDLDPKRRPQAGPLQRDFARLAAVYAATPLAAVIASGQEQCSQPAEEGASVIAASQPEVRCCRLGWLAVRRLPYARPAERSQAVRVRARPGCTAHDKRDKGFKAGAKAASWQLCLTYHPSRPSCRSSQQAPVRRLHLQHRSPRQRRTWPGVHPMR